jgi:hypothetical protein
MMGKLLKVIVRTSAIACFDRGRNAGMQLLPLMREHAAVCNFLRHHMLEAEHSLRHDANLLDQPRGLERLQRVRQSSCFR